MNMRRWFRIITATLCLSFVIAIASGNAHANSTPVTEPDFAAIDVYVAEQVDNLGIPGLALGLVQDGEIVHLQGFGLADSSGRPVSPQTPFYIGSITKSFTALAMMQLVEAGKVDLDAPIQTYLPWFELADQEASARITVRHLLNQTTGISEKDGNSFWASEQGLEETVRGLDTLKLTQPVGSTYQYCNINFMIAGLIVEMVSGQPYAEYVTEHIFEPLDMRHSYASRAPAIADGLAQGHIYMFGRVFSDEGPLPPANLPAGTLVTSVEDLSRYAIVHLNEGRYGDQSILSPQGISELHAPAIPKEGNQHYAMGWNVGAAEGTSYLVHAGDAGRNHAVVILMPDHGTGIVLLSNASGFVQVEQVNEIMRELFFMYNGNSPAPITLPLPLQLIYWGLMLTPLLQILGAVLVWRKRQHIKVWGVLLTVLLNLAVVTLLLRFSLTRITLPSLIVFNPDVGYALVIVLALGTGWSLIFTTMYLMRRRSA